MPDYTKFLFRTIIYFSQKCVQHEHISKKGSPNRTTKSKGEKDMETWTPRPIIIVAAVAVLLVAGTIADLITHQPTGSTTSKPASSAASSSEQNVKVKNIIIQSNPKSSTASSKPSAQEFELNGNLHTGLASNPTSRPNDSTPPSYTSSQVQSHKQTASVILVQSIDTENEIKIDVGESYGINIQFKPANATYKNVTWSTSDDRIAKVDKTGMVTGINTGSCIISVTTVDKNATAKIVVTVIKAVDKGEFS